MEYDNATTLGHTADDAVSGTKLDGVYSMEDYMAKFNTETADPQNTATSGGSSNGKAAPQPRLGPVAVGARTSKHTVALHEKYQALGLPPASFDYTGNSSYGWTGTINFPGLDVKELQGIKIEQAFPSKQEVKEALSERALPILTRLVDEGVVKKMTAETRAKSSKYKVALHEKHQKLGIPQPFFECEGTTEQGWIATISFPGLEELKDTSLKTSIPTRSKQEATEEVSRMAYELITAAEKEVKFDSFAKLKGPAQMQAQDKTAPGPNYTGQLLEFQRAMGAPQPTYHDYQNHIGGTLFTCQVSIDSSDPSTPPQLFGDLTSHCTSKKAARHAAAAHAISHFVAQGTWPSDTLAVGGIKKKPKISNSSTTSSSTSPSSSSSYPQQVQSLAHALGLGTPEWRFSPSAVDPDFYTVACFFAGGGEHAGPIGEVRNAFGKKKAKEECARVTVGYLGEVREGRVRFAEEVMRGVGGGEMDVDVDVDGDGESEGEFEDAVERLGVE